jgi:hypothetical protein
MLIRHQPAPADGLRLPQYREPLGVREVCGEESEIQTDADRKRNAIEKHSRRCA